MHSHVVNRRLDELKPHPNNVRTHSSKQINQIAQSIRTFGFTNPVLIDDTGRILAGHGRVLAAGMLKMEEVPTLCADHLSDDQKRAYMLADNKIAANAGWDYQLLTQELEVLCELDLNFDIEVTGFETVEIDQLLSIGGSDQSKQALEDDAGVPDDISTVTTKVGDMWCLGKHRLLCGDATQKESFDVLCGQELAQMVFIDPPYNVPIEGHVCGFGRIKHKNFQMASGEMSGAEFEAFLTKSFEHIACNTKAAAIVFVCMDWRHIRQVLGAGERIFHELKNLCVWNKDNGGMGSFYRSKHELVFVFKSSAGKHINNFGLGQGGRYRTNVWDYPGVNTLRPSRMEDLSMHPTVKPVSLIADAMKDCSKRGGLILDCFAGSGTTIIAAEKTGRRALGLELDPIYVDAAIRRWQKFTGKTARHAVSNQTFDDLYVQQSAEG